MRFNKKAPSQSGYYWVVDINYPDPFIAFVQQDISYPYLIHMWITCRGEEIWMDEHKWYRFGDKIEKPEPQDNVIE